MSPLVLFSCRSRLAIIPQDPFLFSGSIRENLDPQGKRTDAELHEVLEQCHLKDAITQMGKSEPSKKQLVSSVTGRGGRRPQLGQGAQEKGPRGCSRELVR